LGTLFTSPGLQSPKASRSEAFLDLFLPIDVSVSFKV